MVDSDTVDPVITEIVTTVSCGSLLRNQVTVTLITSFPLKIFHSLRGAGIELREECGKCLGELGAIDPGK